MFSFHKPKIYRSNLGCCICKAKSSSSRFTDSHKYEQEFERCFRIQEKRSGEICNACVLLVKRWKKLSPENRQTKHWHHVVDARAGPGTKLTGNRRLPGPSRSSGDDNDSSSSRRASSNQNNKRSDVLPLSSSHAGNSNNHSLSTSGSASNSSSSSAAATRRANLYNQKACAIDTNVSTFTFGEPRGRGCHLSGPAAAAAAAASSTSNAADYSNSIYSYSQYASHFNSSSSTSTSASYFSANLKPQSALNSSAFESVIKRFRQRQAQQQLEAERRLASRLLRQRRQQQQMQQVARQQQKDNKNDEINDHATNKQLKQEKEQEQSSQQASLLLPESSSSSESLSLSSSSSLSSTKWQQSEQVQPNLNTPPQQKQQQQPSKRQKRFSDSFGSLTVDGSRVTNLLDVTMWRKEKVCCGIIFRGLNNEVAIFPKLLKPCAVRLSHPLSNSNQDENSVFMEEVEDDDEEADEPMEEGEQSLGQPPPPRAFKSGSISSCDSNTSGTGSMEQPIEEQANIVADTVESSPPAKTKVGRRRANASTQQQVATSQATRRPVGRPASIPTTTRRQKLTKRQLQKEQQKTATSANNCDTDSNLSSSCSTSGKNTNQQELNSPTSTMASTSSTSEDSTDARLLLLNEVGEDGDRRLIIELHDHDATNLPSDYVCDDDEDDETSSSMGSLSASEQQQQAASKPDALNAVS